MAKVREALFVGGRFIDPSVGCKPVAESLLAKGGKIACLGAEADVRAAAGPDAATIDLAGRTVVPGWVDAHVHLKSLGTVKNQCDLSGTTSREQAVERIAAFAAERPAAAWIFGRGYNLNAWQDPSYPSAADLDQAVADRPCAVRSFDGHSIWANSAAIAAAGLDADTATPPGGQIIRDQAGQPAGVLLAGAIGLLTRASPDDTPDELDQALRAGVEELVSLGCTGAHWLDLGGETTAARTIERFERLWPNNGCPLRVRVFAPFEDLQAAASLARSADGDDRVQVAGIKCFYDGALGVRTAWMFEPFADTGDNCGISLMDQAELRRRIKLSNKQGLPLICHAVGDRACHEVLAAFAEAGDPTIGNRVEHAQILLAEDIELFARAAVGASVQPSHIWTDWRPSDRLLGPARSARSFPLRSLLEAGAVLAVGSDAPVVPADPRHSLHAAVTRTDAAGDPEGGWHMEQALTVAQWAQAASLGAWESIRQGGLRGRLAIGMDCDLTILREDFLAGGFSDCLGLHVEGVVVGGELTFCGFSAGGAEAGSRR